MILGYFFLLFIEKLMSSKGKENTLVLFLYMHYISQGKYCVKFYLYLTYFFNVKSKKKYTHINMILC